MYRGRLIPSKTYPEGEVFDETYSGDFDWKTANAQDFVCSALVDGFTTAVMHMNAGDRWRVHIPYTLGYGSSGSSSAIPAYSDLIFEVALLDFWSPGDKRPSFKTR
jgi:FKBP-type peptidyl-prolyl cis-trans isomerase FklB